jgi:hypothetical protein
MALYIAMQDYSRREYVTSLLTNFLVVEVSRKNADSAQLLAINFVDPRSLLSWLEMRKLALDIGL